MSSTFSHAVLLSVAAGSIWALSADTFTEVGDAGELLGTAQIASVAGPLTAISGTLIDLGGGKDDVDLYQIFINNPAAFSVSVTSALSADNDSQLFLFNVAGNLVLSDDDDGGALRPAFFAGELGGAAGLYYLGFDLFNTDPTLGVLSGWNRNPAPFQTGPYTLNLTGTSSPQSEIPEPSSVALLATVVGLGLTVRRRLQSRA